MPVYRARPAPMQKINEYNTHQQHCQLNNLYTELFFYDMLILRIVMEEHMIWLNHMTLV